MRKNSEEACKLQERVEQIDQRVTRLETRMADGFQTVTAAVNQLAADFGTRMTNLDTRLIESKVKWGEWARSSLNAVGGWLGKWGGVIILAALGLSNAKSIADIIRGWCA